MAFGFGVLRLSPSAFWNMTPRELKAAMSGISGHLDSSLTRATLDDLMVLFPDDDEKDSF